MSLILPPAPSRGLTWPLHVQGDGDIVLRFFLPPDAVDGQNTTAQLRLGLTVRHLRCSCPRECYREGG